jgi:hypothetical protein
VICEVEESMVMKETVRSLRAYFILGGLAGTFVFASVAQPISQRHIGFETVKYVTSIGFGLVFLYLGFFLRALLKSSAGRIVTFLYISAGWSVLITLVGLLRGDSLYRLPGLPLELLILWYLTRNVRRLATEAWALPLESTPPNN